MQLHCSFSSSPIQTVWKEMTDSNGQGLVREGFHVTDDDNMDDLSCRTAMVNV